MSVILTQSTKTAISRNSISQPPTTTIRNIMKSANQNNDLSCISVPNVEIIAQSLSDGSDLGDAKFVITDKYQYYKDDIPPQDNKCGVYHAKKSELKDTILRVHCPAIVLATVTKGNGDNWYEKSQNIFIKMGEDKIVHELGIFQERLLLYYIIKLLLARILYGKFNVRYLLRKNNAKFLEDLGKSRFCEALHLFLDCDSIIFGYADFFLCDVKCHG